MFEINTYCPFPDCSAVFHTDAPNKSALFNAMCPQCRRLGRVKALEIVDKLKAREQKMYAGKEQDFSIATNSKFHVLLEDIRSLWNVGSIFRSADAIAAAKLYLCGITGCPPRDEISKTALGAEEDIPWTYSVQSLKAVDHLKKSGAIMIGLERNDKSIDLATFLRETKITQPFCLAVGNEVAGLSPELMQACDHICHLPMKGKKESLNVASAFAVAAYFIDDLT